MLHKYQLKPDTFFSFHIMLTDYCNSRCTYCQQFTEYSSQDVELQKLKQLVDFLVDGTKKEKRQIFLEGGEPTFYEHLADFLEYVSSKKESVVLLTNGRVPKKHYDTLVKYVKNGTIKHIWLHVPIWNEPFAEIWKKEIADFLTYASEKQIWAKIIYLGLLYSPDLTLKDILGIFTNHRAFPECTLGMSYCFPHPSTLWRNHIDFDGRIHLMKHVSKAYMYMLKQEVMPIMDGTLPCILKWDSSEQHQLEKYFLSKRVDISSNMEIHIDTKFLANIICNLSDTSYLVSKPMLSYGSFDVFQKEINEEIEKLYHKNFTHMPKECTQCNFFLQWCSGDHFKIISNRKW